MAIPTFVSEGAQASGFGSATPTMPTHQADDILVVVASCNNKTMSTSTSGWTEITEIMPGGSAWAWYWKRATGAGTAGPTITAASVLIYTVGYVFRGCVATGDPFDSGFATSTDGSTVVFVPYTAAITTLGTDRLVIAFHGHGGSTVFSSGFPPAGWAACGAQVGGYQPISKEQAVAGAVAAVDIGTLAADEMHGCLTLGLIPVGAAPPAIPAVRASGAYGSGTTSVTLTMPTVVAGDLILVILESSDSTTAAGTPAVSGYTLIHESTQGSGSTGVTTLSIYGKIAVGSDANVAVTSVGDHVSGHILTIKDHGCASVADVQVGTAQGAGTGNGTALGITTTTANALIVACVASSRDAATTDANMSAWTNANLTGGTEQRDNTVTTGAGGGIGVWTATKVSAGATGNTTVTIGASTVWRAVLLGIKSLSTLTQINATITFNYKVRQIVGDPVSFNYKVRQVVGDPLSLNYKVKTAVNKTRTLQYKVLSAVLDTITLNYKVKATINKTRALQYKVRSIAFDAITLSYKVKTTVNRTRILQYKIRSIVLDTVTLNYKVRAIIFDALTLNYKVRQTINRTRVLQYKVIGRIGDAIILNYKVRSVVFDTVILKYRVPGRVNDAIALNYKIRAVTFDALVLKYRVRIVAFDTVALNYKVRAVVVGTVNLNYKLRAIVFDTLTLDYDIFSIGKIGKNVQLLYKVRTRAFDVISLNYRVRVVAFDALTLKWDVSARAVDSLSLLFVVRVRSLDTLTLSYRLRMALSASRSLPYLIRGKAQDDLTLQYAIFGLVRIFDTLQFQYRVSARVFDNLALQYQLFGLVRAFDTLQLQYRILARTFDDLALQYGILARIARNLALYYQLRELAKVFDSLTLNYNILIPSAFMTNEHWLVSATSSQAVLVSADGLEPAILISAQTLEAELLGVGEINDPTLISAEDIQPAVLRKVKVE